MKCMRVIFWCVVAVDARVNHRMWEKINREGQGIVPKCCTFSILHLLLTQKKSSHNTEVIDRRFSYLAVVSGGSLPMQQQNPS